MSKKTTFIILSFSQDKGMKSKGPKGLIEINNKKIFDYQIKSIFLSQKQLKEEYEILILTNFACDKIYKIMNEKAIIHCIDEEKNPIAEGFSLASSNDVFFIDHGCVFSPEVIKKCMKNNLPTIISAKNKNLDIGIVCEKFKKNVQHMFFDLSAKKFANMFYLQKKQKKIIENNKNLQQKNLMYFEIINYLIEKKEVINEYVVDSGEFMYFNNMRQKNELSKFIKKLY
jgi:hypothetical protein